MLCSIALASPGATSGIENVGPPAVSAHHARIVPNGLEGEIIEKGFLCLAQIRCSISLASRHISRQEWGRVCDYSMSALTHAARVLTDFEQQRVRHPNRRVGLNFRHVTSLTRQEQVFASFLLAP